MQVFHFHMRSSKLPFLYTKDDNFKQFNRLLDRNRGTCLKN